MKKDQRRVVKKYVFYPYQTLEYRKRFLESNIILGGIEAFSVFLYDPQNSIVTDLGKIASDEMLLRTKHISMTFII